MRYPQSKKSRRNARSIRKRGSATNVKKARKKRRSGRRRSEKRYSGFFKKKKSSLNVRDVVEWLEKLQTLCKGLTHEEILLPAPEVFQDDVSRNNYLVEVVEKIIAWIVCEKQVVELQLLNEIYVAVNFMLSYSRDLNTSTELNLECNQAAIHVGSDRINEMVQLFTFNNRYFDVDEAMSEYARNRFSPWKNRSKYTDIMF